MLFSCETLIWGAVSLYGLSKGVGRSMLMTWPCSISLDLAIPSEAYECEWIYLLNDRILRSCLCVYGCNLTSAFKNCKKINDREKFERSTLNLRFLKSEIHIQNTESDSDSRYRNFLKPYLCYFKYGRVGFVISKCCSKLFKSSLSLFWISYNWTSESKFYGRVWKIRKGVERGKFWIILRIRNHWFIYELYFWSNNFRVKCLQW